MKPRIVEHGAFHVVGVRERFLPGKIEGIPALWDRFVRRIDEIDDRIDGVHYGVCVDDSAAGSPGFFYSAATGVKSIGRVPEGMSATTVPAGTFAVFTHKGPITTFSKTIQSVWREWLPASGLMPTGASDFELYDERCTMESPESEVDIYVPVTAPR